MSAQFHLRGDAPSWELMMQFLNSASQDYAQGSRHHENFLAFTRPRRDSGLIALILNMIIHL